MHSEYVVIMLYRWATRPVSALVSAYLNLHRTKLLIFDFTLRVKGTYNHLSSVIDRGEMLLCTSA